jgi:hypothetical protein
LSFTVYPSPVADDEALFSCPAKAISFFIFMQDFADAP